MSLFSASNHQPVHTDEMEDIITTVPSWILRWGTAVFFVILVLFTGLSAVIRYPDIIGASLKIYSPEAPKPVVSKVSGKLVKLLVSENERVSGGQALAYIESTAEHTEVIRLLAALEDVQQLALAGKPVSSSFFDKEACNHLGELQISYQSFFQAYLLYKSAVEDGIYVRKRTYLQHDLADLKKQEAQLHAEKTIQQRDLILAEDEFSMHSKLKDQKVETNNEFRQQESKYLAKKSPLIQTNASLITAGTNYLAKQKEIIELDNQIAEEKLKFSQSLNSLISQAQDWVSKYVLTAPQAGKLTFAGVIQENQVLAPNQEVFYVNPGNEKYFGEMAIPQNSMGKVREGQKVLIKLKSYPFEEYGKLEGEIDNIADVPYKDSVFISKVSFTKAQLSGKNRAIHLKQGMMADAEIITQDATILQRLSRNMIRAINNH